MDFPWRLTLVDDPAERVHAAREAPAGWIETACGRRVLVYARQHDGTVAPTCVRCRRRTGLDDDGPSSS